MTIKKRKKKKKKKKPSVCKPAAPSYRSELDLSSLNSITVVPHLLLFNMSQSASQTSPTDDKHHTIKQG